MNYAIREFVESYVKAIHNGNAAIFAGAGLSMPAGYVNWKELLRDVAEELSLDVDQESDLIALAQYHENEQRSRSKLNQILVEEFTKDAKLTENHKILARLPIRTYWTTNYDKLIEMALEQNAKRVDGKIDPNNLAVTRSRYDAVVYKMHGDISLPHQAVLTKDDYEAYHLTRQLFTTALQGDLVSKTFLFVGYSFNDPNLDYILGRIRVLLGTNQRPHYCFMKQVTRRDFATDGEYDYARTKQHLRINDLKRYSIKVLLVEDYGQITEVLRIIQSIVLRQNVFVSGSAHSYGDWGEERALAFARQLSRRLVSEGLNVVSGFGLGIGSAVIVGALEEVFALREPVADRVQLRPFPQGVLEVEARKALWSEYRTDMLQMSGISIFMFGNKLQDGSVVDASGMIEEFDIGVKLGVIPIPVGATGFTAQHLWDRVMANFGQYVEDQALATAYADLNDSTLTNDELVDRVIRIVKALLRP